MRLAANLTRCCLLAACLALASCSSDSDSPGNSTGGDLNNDPEQQITALNYEKVLQGSLELLRANYYERIVSALATTATLWPENEDAVVGSETFLCTDSGSVLRNVTEAPDRPDASVPDFKLKSSLEFDQCEFAGMKLDGVMTLDWQRSSPAQLGGDSRTWNYGFDQFLYTDGFQEIRVSGQHERRISVAGPSDAYQLISTTDSVLQIQGSIIRSLADAQYTQRYTYQIELPGQDSVFSFTESGQGEVTLVDAGLANLNVLIDPALSYATSDSDTGGTIERAIVAGQVSVQAAGGSTVAASLLVDDSNTVLYVIKDETQQTTNIEGAWLSTATCRNQDLFSYDRCRFVPQLSNSVPVPPTNRSKGAE